MTKEEFVEKAIKIHGDKYDYSKVEYVNNITKISIICKKHGEFLQRPSSHLQGCGCPKCKGVRISEKKKKTTNDFIEKANKIHNNKYDYSKVKYIDSNTKICIVCAEHGEFWQEPRHHLSGCGCKKCSNLENGKKCKHTIEEFINKSKSIHGDKYNYSKVEYVNNKTKVCIICTEHGEFWQTPDCHLQGQGCPKCGLNMSKAEDEIIELLKPLNCQQRNRQIINGKEIDIYIPSLNIGIEYNGLRWHSEEFGKNKDYHLDKLEECNRKNIKLIQIFEDEWINHKEICESKLKQICGLNTNPKIYARKCEVKEITNKNEVYDFLDKNHIQGRTGFTVALGCYFNDKLIGTMTFKREKEDYWDLNRFATDIHYQCIGVGGKLFKYFTEHYDFVEIKSFADRRWTISVNNNLYTKIGFKFDSFVKPTYWYFNRKEKYMRYHKFGFRKQILNKKYGLPLTMTENEMTKELGYSRIWDCGLIKYIYKK